MTKKLTAEEAFFLMMEREDHDEFKIHGVLHALTYAGYDLTDAPVWQLLWTNRRFRELPPEKRMAQMIAHYNAPFGAITEEFIAGLLQAWGEKGEDVSGIDAAELREKTYTEDGDFLQFQADHMDAFREIRFEWAAANKNNP